jgi:ABC-type sugar transport system permease subunit
VRRQGRVRFAFVGPAFTIVAVFVLVPLLATVALSLTSWAGFGLHTIKWAGFDNYVRAVNDGVLWLALLHTLVFVVVMTLLVNLAGFAAAVLINERVRGSSFLRISMFLPLAVSPVVTSLLWFQIIGPYGIINRFAAIFGATQPIGFISDPNLAFYTVLAASVWQISGIAMLIYYAGLQGLPQERMEAARLDGARYLNRVRFIVVPYMRPVIASAVVLSMITAWRIFELVFVLTRGGPARSTEVLATYLYEQGFVRNQYGYASVVAILIAVGAILSTLSRKKIAGDAE